MSPKSLDVLLISKYGQKKTNALVREFSNNMGEVIDKEGIARVVKEMYWTQWIKSYDALNKAYDIFNPYHIKTTTQQNDARGITTKGTGSETSNISLSNTSNISSTDTISNESTSSSTDTNSGSDTNSRTVSDTRNTTETNNLDSPYEDLGTTHEVTNNKTDTTEIGNTESIESQAPYDTSNLKDVSKVKSTNSNTEVSNNSMTEHTLDKSYSKVTNSDNSTESSSVNYGKISTLANESHDAGTTESNSTKTDAGSTESSKTISENKDVTDDLNRRIEIEEEGNKLDVTSQEIIEQELELRKKNLYNRILKDVIELLTLSIY